MAPHETLSVDISEAGRGPWNGHDHGAAGMAPKLKGYPETGISVLVIGSGIGGLMTALECWRKGHSVEILERSAGPVYTGDNLTIQPSAMSIFRHWPELCKEIEQEQYDCWMSYYTHSGQYIYGPNPPSFNDPENTIGRKGPHVALMQSRVKFYKSLIRQVERLGMRVEYNRRVVEYYENSVGSVGGVVLESGQKCEADVVVAADGIRTCSGKIISGGNIQPKESGMAIYRSAYPVENIFSESLVQERWGHKKGDRPIWEFWLGTGLHLLVVITDDIVCWGLTHQDNGSATESWTPNVEPSELPKVMEREAPGWHPAAAAILRTAPKGTVTHWKLMWRDLREDGLRPADALSRYERVSCAQKMSFVNSQIKHRTDWAAVAENPKLIRTRFPRWIYQHDPEAYAYEKFSEAFNHITSGGEAEFQNSNFPPGHVFKKWTIEEVKQEIEAGKQVEALLDGDWT